MAAIQDHNSKLPPKKAKEALPEIPAPNVIAKALVKRDPKKNTMEYTYKYHNVGFADQSKAHNPDAANNGVHNFSLENKARGLQQQASKLRIARLRSHFGNLISAVDNKEETANHPFINMNDPNIGKTVTSMSLSVYNKPKILGRPKTAVNILSGIKGLETVATTEEGVPIPVEVGDQRIPDMETGNLLMMPRTGTEQHRLEIMVECEQIKEKLARDGCPMSMGVLERAMMIPEELEWLPKERKFPDPGYNLMVNPFPKPKKKKKGKKKK